MLDEQAGRMWNHQQHTMVKKSRAYATNQHPRHDALYVDFPSTIKFHTEPLEKCTINMFSCHVDRVFLENVGHPVAPKAD